MSTPIIDDIKQFLPLAPDHLLLPLERVLETIDCPEDFRGLQKVHATLEYLFSIQPTKLSLLIELDVPTAAELLNLFTSISDVYYTKYVNKNHGKGWMSKRPVYSLLFIFCDHRSPEAATALLFFLSHYIANESKISIENRTESSVRAFRLLYTDASVDRACFATSSLNETINNIYNFREALRNEEHEDDNTTSSSRIAYLYDLEHFYRLDWKKRVMRTHASDKIIRGSYSRTKIERIVGSEFLYTASLNKQYLQKDLIDAGVTGTEDYPELSIIKTDQPTQPKPKHELPDISVIKDTAKIRQKNYAISRDVRRSHNITSLSRSLLQPHELSYLWQELSNTRSSLINNIPLNDIKCLLMFILFTGRKLDAVCDLPIDHDAKMEGIGLVVTPDKLQLKVAPKPTAEMGLQSKNPNLLKTKMVATIALPAFLFKRFIGCGLQHGHQTLSGQFSVNKYRKAIESFLKKLNQRHLCQISLQRIEYFLSNVMMAEEKFDPVILEILNGELNYYSRSPRHYAWYSELELNQRIQELWGNIFARIQLYNPQFDIPLIGALPTNKDEFGIGSQYTPSKAAIAAWISLYQANLRQFTAFDVVKRLSTLLDYHNQYTVYTLILLINASGYRAVYSPLPSFDLLLNRYQALCISDKDSSKTFSHTRVVACPSVLMAQLRYYREHVQTLANLISHLLPKDSFHLYAQCCDHQLINLTSKKEKLDWFLSVKNSPSNDGLFLLFLQDKHNKVEGEDTSLRSKNSGPKLLSEFINLPLNFGRHYVRRYLQCKNVHQELIKFQLGHWVAGETPLEKHSSLVHQDAIAQLLPVLDDMIAELGWQAIPSLITRKRA